ncbi:hypothetical protein PVAP13_5NG389581 [Panicum virgatum]|uniref:Uncharacterized protein n=1 Tax=Panicum virgatum TaxID=38727 RepID=A0A8T0RSP7_PANVG|nr:hypothetical protein PVAP13_5NG389581 [Panicum virgatum]
MVDVPTVIDDSYRCEEIRASPNRGWRRYRLYGAIGKEGQKQPRGRGRPKLTWDESVMRDLKDWNISKEIALDRSAWRLAINVPEP